VDLKPGFSDQRKRVIDALIESMGEPESLNGIPGSKIASTCMKLEETVMIC
jgi:hypothetical protein